MSTSTQFLLTIQFQCSDKVTQEQLDQIQQYLTLDVVEQLLIDGSINSGTLDEIAYEAVHVYNLQAMP